jgi:hypothetical protein
VTALGAQAALDGAPQGIFTERLIFQLDRVPRGQPVRMSLIARTSTPRDAVLAIFKNPICAVEERAPFVYDGRMPNTQVDALADRAGLFRRIDLSGLVFGLAVLHPDATAHIVIALEEPLTQAQRVELKNRGVTLRREGFGVVSGEARGGVLADLCLTGWIGPVQVKRVVMP